MQLPHAASHSQKWRKEELKRNANHRTFSVSRGEEEKESELAMGERIVEDYIEEISKDVGIIGEEAIAAPVELAFHVAGEFSVFFVVLSVGAVWVLVWMVTVAFAAWVLNMFGFLNYIFLAFIALFDIIAIAWQTLFAVVFYVVKFVACEFPMISSAIGPSKRGICDKTPTINLQVLPLDENWWKTTGWEKMYALEKTCLQFDTGWEEFQVMFKLLFNDALCPVLMHSKPVEALHTFMDTTLGWMTFRAGEYTQDFGNYGDDRNAEIAELDNMYGHQCQPPPDALFCFIMGIGFMVRIRPLVFDPFHHAWPNILKPLNLLDTGNLDTCHDPFSHLQTFEKNYFCRCKNRSIDSKRFHRGGHLPHRKNPQYHRLGSHSIRLVGRHDRCNFLRGWHPCWLDRTYWISHRGGHRKYPRRHICHIQCRYWKSHTRTLNLESYLSWTNPFCNCYRLMVRH